MTPYQSPPWRKLTELSGGKGVKAEWLDFPEELLAITNEQESAIPCNGRAGCYMNVVQHGPSDIVGICTSDTKQCDRRALKKSELALYRIDHKKLATKIAAAIGFTEQHEKITGHTALWKFGVLNPQAEHSFPVYCFLSQTSSQLDKIINQLCMGEQTFLLIAATSSLISTASSDASSRHKSKLIGIDDVLAVDTVGKVTAKDSAKTIISNWLETALPKSAKPGSEYRFPTPAGATWEQFIFEFQSKEVLLVTVPKTSSLTTQLQEMISFISKMGNDSREQFISLLLQLLHADEYQENISWFSEKIQSYFNGSFSEFFKNIKESALIPYDHPIKTYRWDTIQQRLEPEHLKLKSQTSGKTRTPWTFLLSLAHQKGVIYCNKQQVEDLKKPKQDLKKCLQETFQLSDDPIPWSRKEVCYKARFIIRADDNVLRQLTSSQ